MALVGPKFAGQTGFVISLRLKLLPRPSVCITLATSEPTAAFCVPFTTWLFFTAPNERWAHVQVKMPRVELVAGGNWKNPDPLW